MKNNQNKNKNKKSKKCKRDSKKLLSTLNSKSI